MQLSRLVSAPCRYSRLTAALRQRPRIQAGQDGMNNVLEHVVQNCDAVNCGISACNDAMLPRWYAGERS